MEDLKENYRFILNPYVSQADRFASSLRHLGDRLLRAEKEKENFSCDETEYLCEQVVEKVCHSCERKEICLRENEDCIHQRIAEILCAVEIYGTELNMELKKKLQKQCVMAPRFLRETLEQFEYAKKEMLWKNRLVQNRVQCAAQLETFAQTMQDSVRELDKSIFKDPPLEKKILSQLKKAGLRTLSTVFFLNNRGRYEVHLTVKAEKGASVTTKVLTEIVTKCTGKRMCLAQGGRSIIGQEYETVVCMEGPRYYVMQGVAKIGKGCQKISGDSFSMLVLPGGQEAAILSDGMGTGDKALEESGMIIEMLEELLKAGFPKETALSMMNTALVMGREEVCFSTLDLSMFDLYTGCCECYKAGAAPTFIRRCDRIEHIYSEQLPLGVVSEQHISKVEKQLYPGDLVVMVTDGVLDALPAEGQEGLLDLMILGAAIENPKQMAHYLLEKVLELGQASPKDDMTVLVAGIWDICYNTSEGVRDLGRRS